ncbi:uncharacterized protein LOC133172671 [Saccostrea echinata]|uniref:uncharacterized protein LOC133172671 n=1 Tax=Saccostrea echinata TaxID=191078 RepID=UPI002A81E7A4|nr:uncharacterized protein LOC133172671 [Saccostrea echinata]XP_061163603.1 uncharacterized protein LOC133172671 [Saccostrea echinata]
MEIEQQDCVTSDQTVPDSPKSQQEAGNSDVMIQNENGLLDKNMEAESPMQRVSDDVSANTIQCETSSLVTSDTGKEENVPDVVNTISEIVDPNLEVSTDPVDDGLINEIAKKVDTEDRMTFCIEKPAETLLPVTSQGEKVEEVLVVHPVCAFARPLNMEFDLLEETDVMSELAKEVQLKVNDAQVNSASGDDSATASIEEEKGDKTPSSEEDKVNENSGEGLVDEGIAPVVEQVVRRSQRVYNSLVGPDYAVKVVAPLPLYKKSTLPADTSLVQSGRRPKQVAALKTKKSQLKTGRRSLSVKTDMSRRTPVREESLKMCNPTTSRASSVVSSVYRKDGKGVKKLPKFLSQFSVNSKGGEKMDVKKTLPKNRCNTSLTDAESVRCSTPDKPLQKSASTASLIRKLKMKDGSEVPTPRRSQRIYNSLNGPEEAVNVITSTTRNYRPNDEVVYNSLVGEERDVKLEIPNIRKRIIKKPKPADEMKKTKMSSDEEAKPTQGYSKFDGSLLAESHSGIPLATRIAHEFSQTADTSVKKRSTRSQSKTGEKEQPEEDSGDKINKDSNTSGTPPTESGINEASVLVASSYYTTKRGTQTQVTYSTPSTLSCSTASKKRPAMSASVQKGGSTQRKQNLELGSRPSSATSRTSVASERSLRSSTKTVKDSVDPEKSSTQQMEESTVTKTASLKKSRSSSKLN